MPAGTESHDTDSLPVDPPGFGVETNQAPIVNAGGTLAVQLPQHPGTGDNYSYPGWLSPTILFSLLVEFTDIVMMRKCLLGIMRRAEASAPAVAKAPVVA